MPRDTRPIAMLDSGVGGLSILREVRRQLPNEDVIYFADQGHVPYGPRSVEEIQAFVSGMTHFFLDHEAKVIVIACNAASAASLHYARQTFPEIPFVGMEPAVKPAAQNTQTKTVGVITTQATYQGELFASVIDRFANGVEVVTQVCPEFVSLVEAGELDGEKVRQTAQAYLKPMLEAGIDHLVLGCTHFPFLESALREVIGPAVTIVDPSSAVARQTGRIIVGMRNAPTHIGQLTYYTSGDPEVFYRLASRLMDEPVKRGQVIGIQWNGATVTSGAS